MRKEFVSNLERLGMQTLLPGYEQAVKDTIEYLQEQLHRMKRMAGVLNAEESEEAPEPEVPVVTVSMNGHKKRSNHWNKRTPKQKADWKKTMVAGKKRMEQYRAQEQEKKKSNLSKAAKSSWTKLSPQQRAARIRKTMATRAYKKSLQQPTTPALEVTNAQG